MTKKRWLITGISTGFGRVMAEQLLAKGDDVAGTVRDLAAVEGLKAQYGGRLWLAQLDLTTHGVDPRRGRSCVVRVWPH